MHASRGCGKRNSMEAERQCGQVSKVPGLHIFLWNNLTTINDLNPFDRIHQIVSWDHSPDRKWPGSYRPASTTATARRLSLPGSCKCFDLIDEKLLFDGFIDRLVAQCNWFWVWEDPGEASAGPAMEYILINSSTAAILREEIHSGGFINGRPINWIFQASKIVRSKANKELLTSRVVLSSHTTDIGKRSSKNIPSMPTPPTEE